MPSTKEQPSGSLFEALNEESDNVDQALITYATGNQSRVSLEKRDGLTVSIAYHDIISITHKGTKIWLQHGSNKIIIKGSGLRKLYHALHEGRASRIIEGIYLTDESAVCIEEIRFPERKN